MTNESPTPIAESITDPAQEAPGPKPAITRANILQAARIEFASRGLEGSRVDQIAERSGANKRMIYHYFGNKDGLYQAVLDDIYSELRAHESQLNLQLLSPIEAINRLVESTFWYFHRNSEAVRLLNDENLHDARHIKRSKHIANLRGNLVSMIGHVLERGVAAGLFQRGIDPAHFYITVASVCYFPVSNRATLQAFLGAEIGSDSGVQKQLDYAKRAALGNLLLQAN